MTLDDCRRKGLKRIRQPGWDSEAYIKIFYTAEGNLNVFCRYWDRNQTADGTRYILTQIGGYDGNEWEEFKGTPQVENRI